jgi:hypothetical protein
LVFVLRTTRRRHHVLQAKRTWQITDPSAEDLTKLHEGRYPLKQASAEMRAARAAYLRGPLLVTHTERKNAK